MIKFTFLQKPVTTSVDIIFDLLSLFLSRELNALKYFFNGGGGKHYSNKKN